MERTRLLWMYLERLGLLHLGMKTLHFAPEPGLASRISDVSGVYTPVDFDPEPYKGYLPTIQKVDLCHFTPQEVGEDFDLIVLMHVIEHIPCAIGPALTKLSSLLATGGTMAFAVPIRKRSTTIEDLSTSLDAESRRKRFGQHDHMRIFGDLDVESIMFEALGEGFSVLHQGEHFTERELRMTLTPIGTRS